MENYCKLIIAFAGIFLLCGCTNFNDCTTMSGDNLTDDANMTFVALDRKNYEQRLKFKRPVIIRMSEKGHRFLVEDRRRRGSSKIRLTREFRKELMATADAALNNIVSQLRDFEIINNEAGLRSTPGATVTRVPASTTVPSGPYLFTFNINNVEMLDANNNIRSVTNIADIAMQAGGAPYNSRRAIRRVNSIHWYYAVVTLEVSLTAPDGKSIFNFSESVTLNEQLPSSTPSEATLKQAVKNAVEQAMKQYVVQFGPPLYVDQTIGNGLFVRLSAGSEYGIRRGQKVRFFRKYTRKVPTLPGEPVKYEISKQIVGEGEIGGCAAPVQKDHAWVYVPYNNDPSKRAVFTWTSAEIIK